MPTPNERLGSTATGCADLIGSGMNAAAAPSLERNAKEVSFQKNVVSLY